MNPDQERILRELHDAIIGTPQHPGLLELVRDHERRLARIENISATTARSVLERLFQLIIAGAAGWFSAHFPGTRP